MIPWGTIDAAPTLTRSEVRAQPVPEQSKGPGHLGFDGLYRNAERLGDLRVGEVVAFAEDEHLPSAVGEFVDGAAERRVQVAIVERGEAWLGGFAPLKVRL